MSSTIPDISECLVCPTCQQLLPEEPLDAMTSLEKHLENVLNNITALPYDLYRIGRSYQEYNDVMIDMMREIVSNGGRIATDTQIGKYGYTPLHIAYLQKNENLINFLIEIGADENVEINGKIPSDM
jgi:ankyrin repeat protein